MKIVGLIQARMGSARLPGKVIKEINGIPMIWAIYRRLLSCNQLDGVVVSYSYEEEGCNRIEKVCDKYGMYRSPGVTENLIYRHKIAAESVAADAFVRITADCLFHDPRYIDAMVEAYRNQYPKHRGVTNRYPTRVISEGLDAELYSMELLTELEQSTQCPREDFAVWSEKQGLLSPWIPVGLHLGGNDLHLSIDIQEDFERAEKMLKILGNDNWKYEDTLRAYELTK